MSIYFVYELWDSRSDTIFYVGKGKNKRAERHEKRAMNENNKSHKDLRIRCIKRDGGNVIIKYVFETCVEQDAYDEEIRLIKFYGRNDIGTGPLLNHTDGGEGGDTAAFLSKEAKKARYEKRQRTLDSRSDDTKALHHSKHSKGSKRNWIVNRESMMAGCRKSIEKRDRLAHAKAVSNGWKNRSEEDREKTRQLKSEITKERLATKDGSEKFKKTIAAANEAVSISITVTTPDGRELSAKSVSEWCRLYCDEFNLNKGSTHDTLCKMLKGYKPKLKYSKWHGWQVRRD